MSRDRNVSLAAALLLASFTRPAAARSEADAATAALDHIDRLCVDQPREARREFERERHRAEHSLESLDLRASSREKTVEETRRAYEKRTAEISKECRDAKTAYVRRFINPSSIEHIGKENAATALEPTKTAEENEDAFFSRLHLHGDVHQEAVYRTDAPEEWRRNRSQLRLAQSGRLIDDWRYRVSGRAFFDTVVADHNRDQKDAGLPEDSLESGASLREAFVDGSVGPFDLRLGRQTIVWGEAVSVFVADIVNAKDYRDYILPDFDWIRIPQWAADVTWIHGGVTQQLIWTVPEFNRFASPGSDFALPTFAPPGVPTTTTDPKKPPVTVANSAVGTRVSALMLGFDLGLFIFDGWDQSAIPYHSLVNGVLENEPAYRRQSTLGGTFSKSLGDTILKGEAAVRPDSRLGSSSPSVSDGVVRKTVFDSVLGLDRTIGGRLDANLQLIDHRIAGFRPEDALVNEQRIREHVSLRLKMDFADGRWSLEGLVVAGVEEKDRLWRPSVNIRLSDHATLRFGDDIFEGKPERGLFGLFENQDRAYTKLDYLF